MSQVEVIRGPNLGGIPHGFLGRRGGVSTGAVSTGGSWEIVQGLSISEAARAGIDVSVGELVEERDAVKELGLI